MSEVKRIFVGGLVPEITEKELTERFQRFCDVVKVEIKQKKVDGHIGKTFAYLNVNASPENIEKCISLYDKTKWKGSELRIQLAKENFLSRLENERKNGFQAEQVKKVKKKNTVELHNPFENLPDPLTPEMKGCVPGTKVPGEKNWVVGKYGRVLPVVFVRNKKQVQKVDPSKFCHNLKRIKHEDEPVPAQSKLTLDIEEIDTDISRKRKGEFSPWKPTPVKNKKYDFDALREKYLNSDNNKPIDNYVRNEPDFEVVPENSWLSELNNPSGNRESDDSDSDFDYTSMKKSGSSLRSNKPQIHTDKSSFIRLSQGDIDSGSDADTQQTNIFKGASDTEDAKESLSLSSANSQTLKAKTKPKLKPFGGTQLMNDVSNVNNNSQKNEAYLSPTVANQENKATRPKLKPFGGTRSLYDVSHVNNQKCEALASPSVSNQENKVLTTDSSDKEHIPVKKNSDIVSPSKDTNSKQNSKKGKKVEQLDISKPQDEYDGYMSASSADTDEIITRFRDMSPVGDSPNVENSANVFSFSKPSINAKRLVPQSKVNEFSSGLLDGEVPDYDSSDDDRRYSTDSDDSDFEKFAIKETKKFKSKSRDDPGFQMALSESEKMKEHVLFGEDKSKRLNSNISKDKKNEKKLESEKTVIGAKDKLMVDSNKSIKDIQRTIEKSNLKSSKMFDDSTSKSVKSDLTTKNVRSDSPSRTIKGETASNLTNKKVKSDSSREKAKSDSTSKTVQGETTSKNVKNDLTSQSVQADKGKKPGDLDSNQKRIESLKKRQEERKSQMSAIKNALDNIDAKTNFNKKIVFDSESDDSEADGISKGATNNSQSKVSQESSTSESDSDEDEDVMPSKEDRKMTLFDSPEGSEDEDDDDDDDKDMFKIRPEFEGKYGHKNMELQSRYGNDQRFKLDERFIESDNEADDEGGFDPPKDDEKTRTLKILEEVVGPNLKKTEKRKMIKDTSALHFDPTREDHSQFELEPSGKSKQKKEKKTIQEKETNIVESKEPVESDEPVVSKDKFFEVSTSLTDTFKSSKEANDSQGFSLLSSFGTFAGEDNTDKKDSAVTKTLNNESSPFPWQQKFPEDYSSSSDGEKQKEADSDGDDDMMEGPVVFRAEKSLFFFQEDDERITEGANRFHRQEDYEEIKKKWLDKRPSLVEEYRTKHKRLLRKTKNDGKYKRTSFHKSRTK